MLRLRSFQNSLALVILVFSLTAIYVRTLAPGLTWANGGSDGGDLITAAATGGVAHPTGYPLYLLVARFFQYLPVGSLAFRTNLMSVLATSFAAVLVFRLVAGTMLNSKAGPTWLAGMGAGYAFGLAPLIWSQALITEVYALQAFLTALIMYLYAYPVQDSSINPKRLDAWRGLVLGLAMGNHITTILLVPVALLIGSTDDQSKLNGTADSKRSGLESLTFDSASLRRQLTWFIAGLSVYLLLPLQALADPSINWGNVISPDRLWWLVSGELYQGYYLQFTLSEVYIHLQAWAALLLQQFGLLGVAVGVVGLIVFGYRSRIYLITVWTAVAYTVFAVFYRSVDSYVYLIPMFLSFAIWIGMGIAGLTFPFTKDSSVIRVGLALLVIGFFAVRVTVLMSQVDASQDLRAEAFGKEVMSSAPENAIIFARGDKAVFALWYFHFALGERPDLCVLAVDLLHFDWYLENIRMLYPWLKIPGPLAWPTTIAAANPSHAICDIHFSEGTVMNCTASRNVP